MDTSLFQNQVILGDQQNSKTHIQVTSPQEQDKETRHRENGETYQLVSSNNGTHWNRLFPECPVHIQYRQTHSGEKSSQVCGKHFHVVSVCMFSVLLKHVIGSDAFTLYLEKPDEWMEKTHALSFYLNLIHPIIGV